jgi:[ribosomal protein S5]-alanine N-acetyltransferase
MLVPNITTDRLTLKGLNPEELNSTYPDWLNDPRVNRFLEVRFYPQTAESVAAFVRDMNASPDNHLFGIFLRANEHHIGNIKLGPVDKHHNRGAVGLLIGDPHEWGKGYAAEAIMAVTNFAFGTLGLTKVTAGCYGINAGSRNAFIRAGWQEIARRPLHWRYDEGWTDDVVLECLNPSL